MKYLFLTVFLWCLFSTCNAAEEPVLSFNIFFNGEDYTDTTYIAAPGENISVELFFNISEGGAIGSAFDLSFSSYILRASNLQEGDGWNNPSTSTIDNTNGNILFEALSFTAQSSGKLASFDLTVTGYGVSDLIIGDFNDQANWLVDPGNIVLDEQLSQAYTLAAVQTVPLPASCYLLITAIAGLIRLHSKKR